jgi:hypothetical protein
MTRLHIAHWFALLVTIASAPYVLAQPAQDVAVTQARELADALRSLDAEKVAFFSAPKFRAALGGEQQLLRALVQEFERGRAMGVSIDTIDLGVPTEVGKDNGALFTFIPYTAIARSKTQVVIDKAFYLAISEDDGKTWKFVDGIRFDAGVLRYFLPAYAGEPPLPARSRQVQPVEAAR